jgi:hypothetical protein
MENQIIIDFLKSFFSLFKAQIEKFKFVDNKIIGIVGWAGEEDKQDFIWAIVANQFLLVNAKLLCDYLNNNNLVKGDLVIISEQELILRLIILGWNKEDIRISIDFLFSVGVKMLDNGEETDSFFLHF